MNSLKALNRKGWQFVVLTIMLSCIPYFFIISEKSLESNWPLLLMWMPGIAGLIMRVWNKEGLFSGLSWNPLKSLKWILLAAAVPFAIDVLSVLLTLLFGGAVFEETFLTIEKGMVQIRGVAMIFGAAEQPWYVFIPNFLLSYFVGVLFYSLLFAFGEELGWRGYLQKHWAPKNDLYAFLIVGIIWGLWHLPGILLGHNFPEYPVFGGLILMPVTTIAFSVCFGILFNRKFAIWVPAVFHGAVNISAEVSNKAFVEGSVNNYINDALWISLWLLTGALFWLKFRKK
ncbi:MAG: CPBP family intramembrane glutamic endopeptidase [Cyclobacteriaceae bacterium]